MRKNGFGAYGLIVAAAVAATATADAAPAAAPVSPVLVSRPQAVAGSLPAGITKIAGDSIVYRPAALAPGAHPLVVLLHGAGHGPDELIPAFRPQADQRGLILLAPKSGGSTWDLITSALRLGDKTKKGERPEFGPDVARVDAALANVFRNAAIDPNRIILAGFSDGAGYALSLGLANPRLFHGVVAFAPGMLLPPGEVSLGQRIFIAHGRADRVIPIRVSRDGLAPALTAAGMKIQFREFGGGHGIDRKVLDEGLTFVLQN